jgi:hypothetical protein
MESSKVAIAAKIRLRAGESFEGGAIVVAYRVEPFRRIDLMRL